MRDSTRLLLAAIIAACPLLIASRPAGAQQRPDSASRDSVERRLQRMQRQIDSLRLASDRQTQRIMELDERGAAAAAAGAPSVAAGGDTTRRKPASIQGIYGKPFVKRFGSGTAIGGYVDMEYKNDIDGHTSTFDQHRLIPFIFSEITDRLHFGTEIEFEHAPSIEAEDGKAEGAGEVRVEFATLDYRFREALNLRGGMILAPLGRFNLVHDSPVNDLTERPLVDRYIIPTTLSQTGAGFFGTLYPTDRSLVTYEAYLVNGFSNAIVGDEGVVLRDGTGFSENDNNFAKSVVGRVALSPVLGLEIGVSGTTGKYATKTEAPAVPLPETLIFTGDERLSIGALDATFSRGPLELLGEYGRVRIDVPKPSGLVAAPRDGYYAQANYHFGHGLLVPRATSTFTGVVRWDRVNMSGAEGFDARERLTLGVNWRPVEDAVLKTDFLWNWDTTAGAAERGPVDRQFRISLASYF